MKKIGTLIMLTALLIQGFSQEVSAEKKDTLQKSSSINDNTKVDVGHGLIIVEDNKDELNIRVGNRGVTILESLEGKGPKIQFEKFSSDETDVWNDQDNADNDKAKMSNRFKGHWAGFEFGFNNYMTSDNSLSMPVNIDYMTLHSGKSNNFNLNFSQMSMGITRRIGIVTGLGLNWNNYRFDYNNNITKGVNGVIEMFDPGAVLKKSKLTTLYLDLPILLEVQIPADNNHLNLAVGPIGAVKLGSHSKMVYEDGNKLKSDGDFSLNILRYGATARLGFENFQIYGTYYLTPLFKSGKSPDGVELFPFELGFAFSFND
jgi:hypothetical protein